MAYWNRLETPDRELVRFDSGDDKLGELIAAVGVVLELGALARKRSGGGSGRRPSSVDKCSVASYPELHPNNTQNRALLCYLVEKLYGGEGGIRTHGTLSGSTVFETARFNRSRTSPSTGSLQPI